jgi:hypothetical protein
MVVATSLKILYSFLYREYIQWEGEEGDERV